MFRHRDRHHNHYGRRGRRGRRYIPVPPNDQNNYFFSNRDCGKYQTNGYMQHPNYSMEEAQQFIYNVNENHVASLTSIGVCIVGIIFGSLIMNISLIQIFQLVGCVVNIISIGWFIRYSIMKKRSLKMFLTQENVKLAGRGVHWDLEPR